MYTIYKIPEKEIIDMNYWFNIDLSKENYFPSVAVAAVDILGMKNMLKSEDECISASLMLAKFVEEASINEYYRDESLNKSLGKLYEDAIYFADSVYLFANPKTDIHKQIDLLIKTCSSLITKGLNNGYLLRIGIATGDLRLSKVRLFDDREVILRVGNSMVKAHILQESQEWIGGAVDFRFPVNSKSYFRIDYNVPIKKKSEYFGKKLVALNWVRMLASRTSVKHTNEEICSLIKNGIHNINRLMDDKIKLKYNNTLKFVEYVFIKEQNTP